MLVSIKKGLCITMNKSRQPLNPATYMISLTLLLTLLAGCANPAQNTAKAVNKTPQTAHTVGITSLHMFDVRTGWALSENASLLLRTTDGGNTWKNIAPLATAIDAVYFLNASTGWAAVPQGKNGTTQLLRTANGGQTWQGVTIPVKNTGQLMFVDALHGWLVTAYDPNSTIIYILRTADGGKTWVNVASTEAQKGPASAASLPANAGMTGINFVNVTTGWATSAYMGQNNVPWFYVTHDGGQTWLPQSLALPQRIQSAQPALMPPTFLTARAGFLPANGYFPGCGVGTVSSVIYTTQNSGTTWQSTTPLPIPSTASTFSDPSHGWVTDGHTLNATSDSGLHWTALPINSIFSGVQSLNFVSSTTGWAISQTTSSSPHLLKTVDGGTSWTMLSPIIVAGKTARLTLNNSLQQVASLPAPKTIPAQAQLTTQVSIGDANAIGTIHMSDANNGWALTVGAKYTPRLVLHTSDGGKTWQDVSPKLHGTYSADDYITDFLNGSTAWLAALYYTQSSNNGRVVYHTIDGGQTWQESIIPIDSSIQDYEPLQISFINAQDGWILFTSSQDSMSNTLAYLFRTTDGGKSWIKIATAGTSSGALPLNSDKQGLSFLNASTGWVTSYGDNNQPVQLYKTVDGGQTWQRQTLQLPAQIAPNPVSILAPSFFNASNGILPVLYYNSGNDRGIDIYITHDGGAHWQSTTPLASNVYASGTIEQTIETIDFIDVNHGWIVDANGTTLYATSDGGQHWTTSIKFNTISSVSFVSTSTAWAIGSNSCSALLTTHDGGQTWSGINYTIAG